MSLGKKHPHLQMHKFEDAKADTDGREWPGSLMHEVCRRQGTQSQEELPLGPHC